MAKLIFQNTGKEVELPDGSPIADACQEAGVIFACSGGLCGACAVTICDGEENLSEPTEAELDFFGLEGVKKERMACQSSIVSGEVTIET